MNMYENFRAIFTIECGSNKTLIKDAQHLRYDIFCEDNNIIPSDNLRERIEEDEYDTRASHCLIRHKETGVGVATTRLVLFDKNDEKALYPTEKVGKYVRPEGYNIWNIPREEIGEISRTAISRFKGKNKDGKYLSNVKISKEDLKIIREWYPYLLLGLFRGIVDMSCLHGVECWYTTMEKRLNRLLRRSGVHFQDVGEPIEFHGKRQPSVALKSVILKNMKETNNAVWQFITA